MHQFVKTNIPQKRPQDKCETCGQPESDRHHPHRFDRALYQTTLCKCGLHIESDCHIDKPLKNQPTPYQKRAS